MILEKGDYLLYVLGGYLLLQWEFIDIGKVGIDIGKVDIDIGKVNQNSLILEKLALILEKLIRIH